MKKEVREMAGVMGQDPQAPGINRWVQARERDDGVIIDRPDSAVHLSTAAARRFARQLQRLATRVENREEQTS